MKTKLSDWAKVWGTAIKRDAPTGVKFVLLVNDEAGNTGAIYYTHDSERLVYALLEAASDCSKSLQTGRVIGVSDV